MIGDDLEEILLRPGGGQTSSWGWATVTQVTPSLRVRLDGQSTALPVTPQSLVTGLVVGDRVWVQLAGRRLVVHGGPGPGLRGPQGVIGRLVSTAQYTTGSTTSYGADPNLTGNITTGPGSRLVRVSLQAVVSVTGTGTFNVQARIRRGSTTLLEGRSAPMGTNGNSGINLYDVVEVPEGTASWSVELAPNSAVTTRMRGDVHPCILLVEDTGPA